MKNIDSLIEKIYRSVEKHYLGNGAYKRFLLQDEKNTRSMDINEYGCADAINILYSINRLPKGEEREKCIRALQGLQKKDSGLFEEKTHHFIPTTAHCIAALEIFDAEARAKEKQAYVSVNWPQAVLRVRFEEGVGEEQIEMEEANEGEKE